MPDDNIPSQKYRDTGIPRYLVTLSIVKKLLQKSNRTNHLSALADSLCHIHVMLMILHVKYLPLDVVVMLMAFMLKF